ncbi:MAG: oligosaccharide flippase family protein [Bacilli bacterium]|nr:oligosaccharide flippase family protein [Bacilli bacterium]
MKNTLVKNTLILIITSLIIRILSLVNRIFLTRLLGMEGISLYVIVLPSIMLFMSIAGFSLNTSLSKIVSENLVTKKYSEKKIITTAVTIGFTTTAITSLVVILIIKPLVNQGLRQSEAFYPILSCLLFLPLVMLNNILRGYFNGRNKINISAYANLIEQISRILTGIIFLLIFHPYGLIVSVTMTIIAMGVGELISLIFTIIKIKNFKNKLIIDSKNDPKKSILSIAVPTTFSRLLGNLCEFFEPILYTAALIKIGFNSKEILYKYSAITAYALPLITLSSFLSQSIATSIIPNISHSNAQGKTDEVVHYIKKSLLLSFVPGILVTLMLSNYGLEYMQLIYGTDIGANYVQNLSIFFIFYYLLSPLWAIMQAIGKSKFLLKMNFIFDVFKLTLVYFLTFIPWISYHSLMVVLLANTVIASMVIYFYLKNKFHFRFQKTEILKILILAIASFLFLEILKAGINNYLLNTLIISIFFLILARILKVTSLNNK